MTQKKTPETKEMMGVRKSDSDGFTYSYGAHPFNKTKGHMAYVKRCIRNDKRSVKAKEASRIRKDDEGGGEE